MVELLLQVQLQMFRMLPEFCNITKYINGTLHMRYINLILVKQRHMFVAHFCKNKRFFL